jgi:membrane protein YdbS with pleckstrin-like domain
MSGALVNTSVFVFCFAFAFLLAGRRQVLATSTRVVLLVTVAMAAAFALVVDEPYHSTFGAAALIANTLFVLFAGLDFRRWRSRRDGSES